MTVSTYETRPLSPDSYIYIREARKIDMKVADTFWRFGGVTEIFENFFEVPDSLWPWSFPRFESETVRDVSHFCAHWM
jgi:hypothetical protein